MPHRGQVAKPYQKVVVLQDLDQARLSASPSTSTSFSPPSPPSYILSQPVGLGWSFPMAYMLIGFFVLNICFAMGLLVFEVISLRPMQSTPVYYINTDASVARREFFENQMMDHRLKATRIAALTTKNFSSISLETVSLNLHTPAELACLSSHLLAIYQAVHDPTADPDVPYAIIMEDDAQLAMRVDFASLIESAPRDFGILQLTTSNSEAAETFWKEYDIGIKRTMRKAEAALRGDNNNIVLESRGADDTTNDKVLATIMEESSAELWKPYSWQLGTWSTQAYVINKNVVGPIIDSMVSISPKTGLPVISITFPRHLVPPTTKTLEILKVLPFRLVADLYLYSAFGPTFVFKIPIIVSASVGSVSQVQTVFKSLQVEQSFHAIKGLIQQVRTRTEELPVFLDTREDLMNVTPDTTSITVTAGGRGGVSNPSLRGDKRGSALRPRAKTWAALLTSEMSWHM